jgi:hypothetical protein
MGISTVRSAGLAVETAHSIHIFQEGMFYIKMKIICSFVDEVPEIQSNCMHITAPANLLR